MAQVNSRQPGYDPQLFFDFTFDDVSGHVKKNVTAHIAEAEKTLPQASAALPPYSPHGDPVSFNTALFQSPYGAWLSFDRRLSVTDRNRYNRLALEIIQKPLNAVTNEDRAVLRFYSGFGGTGQEGERGVLYDYYTSPPIAGMVWQIVDKIKPIRRGDRILEPSCGTGVFFATAPGGVTLAGVELDPRTAAVARALHPAAHIQNMSFEAFNISRDASQVFDYLIGNAPFGERSADTKFLDFPDEKSLDRYFISRGIDALKPGGVMALIVHPGILENQGNAPFRAAVSRKALFLGAVRLNDHSFAHTHTQIQPDILFFQKHSEGMEQYLTRIPDNELPAALHTGFISPAFGYYNIYPQHIMGRVNGGGGRWGSNAVQGRVTAETVTEIIQNFSPGFTAEDPDTLKAYDEIKQKYPLPAAAVETPPPIRRRLNLTPDETGLASLKRLRPGFLKTENNGVYILSEGLFWETASTDPNLAGRVKHILGISNGVRRIRDAMRDSLDPKPLQARAVQSLEAYKQAFGNYPKNDPPLYSFIRKFPSVSGIYDGLIDAAAPVITEDNLYGAAARVNGHSPAVQALYTLREHLQPGTPQTIAAWFPDDAEKLIQEMNGCPDIFLTPHNEYQLREDFISGNAWEKIDSLEKAKADYAADPSAVKRFSDYQNQLRAAAAWTPVEEANASPRASWIPVDMVNAFIHSEDHCPRYYSFNDVTLGKNEAGKWGRIVKKTWEPYADPVVYYLNYQKQRTRYNDTAEFNKEYDERFIDFISSSPLYRETVENTFNRLYNAEIKSPVKTYPVYIEGWTGAKTLRGHQLQSVHHLYRTGKGISALGTGFGKTLAGIALFSLLRQEGKIHRAFFQVPNNKVKDWVSEISDVMPSLKVGYIDPEMPGYSSRDKRYAAYHRLANSAYDILIFPESAAGEIQLRPENDETITESIAASHIHEKKPSTARKTQILEDRVQEFLQDGKTNRSISFEDLGCDAVFVDEAHRYKNLFTSSLARDVGLNDGRQSSKAMSLFKKTAYIRQRHNGKNVFLFTATPLTNSPLEYYNMLMYIAPEELERFGIYTIDNFIHNFADIREAETYDWKTGKITAKNILLGFYNIHTLQDLFFKYVDYQNDPKSINLDKPDPLHAPNIIPKNTLQTAAVKKISSDLETYTNAAPEKREELFPHQNYLTFYTKLRTASLDLELYDPGKFPAWRNPKLEALAANTDAVFRRTNAGQVIFCDRVFSSDASFNMHDKIKNYLIEKGFKSQEIAVVNGFTKSGGLMSDSETEKLVSRTVADYNKGVYKVLIGTTACIGEGLNLQENSSAVHHFDIPFRPSDFIQRNGRIDRQGNNQDTVHINTYMASGTIDTYSVNLVQNKANWIDELLKSKTSVFTNMDDESSINPQELLLALAGEWGDAGKAKALRQEMERAAAGKLAEENDVKRRGLISSLAKLRAPLYNYRGDKKSFSYLQRLERINNIEKTLTANPSFTHKEILGGKEPFLYSSEHDKVVMIGDYYRYYSTHSLITGINLKKQEFTIQLLSGIKSDPLSIPIRNFEAGGDDFIHLPGNDFFTALKNINSRVFYSIPENGIKEKFYPAHLEEYREKAAIPLIQSDGEHIIIGYTDTVTTYEKRNAVNPFSTEGIEKIKAAKTITFKPDEVNLDNKHILKDMQLFMPEVFQAVSGKLPATPPFYPIIASEGCCDQKTLETVIGCLCSYPYYKNDPMLAAKTVLENTPEKQKDGIKIFLRKAGCLDPVSTKNIILAFSHKNSIDNITDIEPFIKEHLRVAGIEI
jgi:SAM-dependent methyltransferase